MTSDGELAERSSTQEVHLDVHPSVVFKLGEDLISDSMQALAELVKNSYDADASYARVTIWTGKSAGDESLQNQPTFMRVEDDGAGMDVDDIIRGWLTISNSRKREMKLAGQETRLGRTPLGDKGLGRLGAQRLGQQMQIITRPLGSDQEHEISIDWASFNDQGSLSSVPLQLTTRPASRQPGTTLTIFGLREPEQWAKSTRDGQSLQRELSVLISPYGQTRGFRVFLSIDEDSVDLYSLSAQVREAADYRFRLDYADGVFLIDGALKLDLLAPSQGTSAEDKQLYQRLIRDDNGKSFWRWMQANRKNQVESFGWEPSSDSRYFLEFSHREELRSIGGVGSTDAQVADPGPFTGEIDSVDLGNESIAAFSNRSEFRSYVKSLSGIRVYRDGFGIRMDGDWLGLRKSATSGGSYYALRPENTLGFVDISAKYNAQLTETTDREGFADTPAYRNFNLLLQTWRRFADKLAEALRRSYNSYRSSFRAAEANVDLSTDAEVLLRRVDERITTVVRARRQLNSLKGDSKAAAESAQRVREELDGDQASFASMAMSPEIANALDEINQAHLRATAAVTEIGALLDSLEAERAVIQILRDQSEQVREQLSLTWETVSLGLTAEAISHEVATIAEGLSVRTGQIKRHMQAEMPLDQKVAAYFQFMQSTSSALKRQLAHLNPSLRYMRERREKILISSFCDEVVDYYTQRWQSGPLSIRFHRLPQDDFTVAVNKGKLTQVFDNLILNSEYWLTHDHRLGLVAEPSVNIEVQAPFVFVSDNGQGINPAVEHSLFEPFVSSKGRGEGRGLGLYVITQLLDSDRCTISLNPQRNAQGRLYGFVLDLGGMRVN
ncbi:ATP-binding protein [Streptomyces sp. NPDC001100]